MLQELAATQLTHACDPGQLHFDTSADVEPLAGIVGQERALRALRFGLAIDSDGFNIFVAGSPGTGRTTAIKGFLDELAREKHVPQDWCYVNNFRDSYYPKAVQLPAGQGRRLAQDMGTLVSEVQLRFASLFEDDAYTQRREALERQVSEQQQGVFSQLDQNVQRAGFMVQASQEGLNLLPVQDGRAMTPEEYAALSEEQRQALSGTRATLEPLVTAALRQVRQAEIRAKAQLKQMDQEIAGSVLRPLVDELRSRYQSSPQVVAYLDAVQDDMLAHLDRFSATTASSSGTHSGASDRPEIGAALRAYVVNVIVDNAELQGAPVFSELSVNYDRLFGIIERQSELGVMTTDFTMIKGGVLHRANGGYLVLPVEPLVANSYVWEALKRALRSRSIAIEEPPERAAAVPMKSLQPDPIPLEAKIVLMGDPVAHHLLYAMDQDFRELFKVKAEFDTVMARTAESERAYCSFVRSLCDKDGLRHLSRDAVARVIEYGSLLAEDQNKLSTHFGRLADLLREANHYADQDGVAHVQGSHILRAMAEKTHRSDLVQQHLAQSIARGQLLIATDGEAVGQINALSVLNVGDYAFGFPTRTTATVGAGRDGVLDINREAELSGPIHTKGVLIIGGYLAGKYAQDRALALSARLVFEQNYDETEGDSASGAELFALLSALSGLPIRQGIAVTGAVSQRGQLQAIGGVNEKIEGFFDLCKSRELTGRQGVLIPTSNAQSLLLKEEVVDAVRQGLFHIYAADSVDSAMEVLTGVAAGERGADGHYPEATINGKVDARLEHLCEDTRRTESADKSD